MICPTCGIGCSFICPSCLEGVFSKWHESEDAKKFGEKVRKLKEVGVSTQLIELEDTDKGTV